MELYHVTIWYEDSDNARHLFHYIIMANSPDEAVGHIKQLNTDYLNASIDVEQVYFSKVRPFWVLSYQYSKEE